MAKRRDQIAMTEAEIRSFIETQKTVQVATINKDGTPHLVPLWFAVVDGDIVLETFTKSQKVVNLERDPRLTLLLAHFGHVRAMVSSRMVPLKIRSTAMATTAAGKVAATVRPARIPT